MGVRKLLASERRLVDIEIACRRAGIYQAFALAFPSDRKRPIGGLCFDEWGAGLPGAPGMLPSEQMFGRVRYEGA